MSAALALQRPAYESRAHVACARGDVWAGASCTQVDAVRRAAIFAVRIANNSEVPLRARIGCRTAPANAPGAEVAVAAFSILEAFVPVPLRALGGSDRATIVIEGAGVAFSLCVPSAPRSALRGALAAWGPLAAGLAAFVVLAVVAIAATMAPQRAKAVARVLPVPSAAASARPQPPVRRPVAPDDATPLLDDLTVSPLPARAGTSLKVAYAAASTAGDVWLLDLHGQVWAHASTDPSGTTWLHVPPGAAGREMRVVVHVHRGARHAQSGVGISVVPDGELVAAAQSADGGGTDVSVTPLRAASGTPIRVVLGVNHGEALVSLTDASGSVLQEVDAPANSRGAIVLTAPGVSAAGTYDVVVSLARGVSQEEIVRSVTVVP